MPKWDGQAECIGEIRALKRQSSGDQAQELLNRVYRYVLPIMRRRSMRVHKLVEFLPRNPNLLGLNVNHGQSISIRLRHNHAPSEFLPFESVLGTMLHELCHNVFGPHDARFFRMLDELTVELEDMMSRGFSGDLFLGTGNLLGSGKALTPWDAKHRRTLLRHRPTLRGSGVKLGGSRPLQSRRGLRELALKAAERRRDADNSCGSGRKELNFNDLGYEEISRDEFMRMISTVNRQSPAAESKYACTPRPSSDIIDLTKD